MSLIATLLAAFALSSAPDVSALQATAADLNAEAAARAERLTDASQAQTLSPDDPVLEQLGRLSALAADHARAIDAARGAGDLACIFRGLSADAASWPERLDAAPDATEQARAWREIARMADHAERLSAEAIHSGPPAPCSASR
ncbi:hypothetical protein F1654_07905 [Alkalicaulis satelles]|uniref:Uncharacterized protein n=1 Tax=Alkalicaulis satelles TaxID=2609175 RepID=A0A5M6ZJ50_9PROT|nr:hypothetical protein [Alkalicaulis satelles]KAA5803717.1 hypothetical protein F1654_07905 [Alkalicaulis satelles]